MAAITVKSWQRAEYRDSYGNVHPLGKRLGDAPDTIAAANGEIHVAEPIVADDETKVALWATGDSGLANYSYLWFWSDVAVLLEFVGTGPIYNVVGIAAGEIYTRQTDDMLSSITVTSETTTMVQVIAINVQNNVGEGAGDAKVKLVLLD